MKPITTINLYHETADRRVLSYLNKNMATHELVTAGRKNLVQTQIKRGNGNIRNFLALIALIGLFAFAAFGIAP